MKKVIFSFFPFREVLGLGLKILFHKNKEIKRMLSKKMAFSLMSLITLLAFAFVVTPAMAAEFGVAMSIRPDDNINAADGNHRYKGWEVWVDIRFDKIVALDTGAKVGTDLTKFHLSDIQVIAYNKNNGVEPSPTLDNPHVDGRADGKNYRFRVQSAGDDVTKVLLYLGKGKVEVADPRADFDDATGKRKVEGMNAAASIEILYIARDTGSPHVYSIRRAGDSLLPIKAGTDATVNVIVLLSELPAEFTKDQILVTHATAADPVALPLQLVDQEAVNRLEAVYELSDDFIAKPMFRVPNPDTETDAEGYAGAMILNPETLDITGDDSPLYEGTFPEGTFDYAADGFNYSIDDSADTPIAALKTALDSAMEAVGTAMDAIDTAGTLDAYDLAKIRHAESVTAHSTASTAYTDALATLEQVQFDEYDRDLQAHFDGLFQFYGARAQGTDIPRNNQLPATGSSEKLHPYVVTLTPEYKTTDAIVVKVNTFDDTRKPVPNTYIPPRTEIAYRESVDKLSIVVGKADPAALAAGHPVDLTNKRVVPAGGYLIVATDLAGTGINLPTDSNADDNVPLANERSPAELKYNAIPVALPDLEGFLANGGTIDLVSPDKGLIISEIMWGSDASLATNSHSQWIEIKNTTAANITTGDTTNKLIFYDPNEALPDMSVAANNIQDRVGTVGAGGYWSIIGKGQSGRTGVGEAAADLAAVIPTLAIISMQRAIDATTGAADGTMASSWAQSTPPAVNFTPGAGGNRIASPGDDGSAIAYPTAPIPEPEAVTVPVAESDDIVITEIMVDTGGGRLPQWIELTNVSGAEVSLAGWSIDISNDAADADVVGSSVSIDLSGTLGVGGGEDAGGTMGKSLLLVAGNARSSSNLVGSARVVDVSDQVGETGRYTLISEMAFIVALVPPQKTGVLKYGDTAGNLDAAEAWEIPMAEGARSSLIRREMDELDMATMGTAANGWIMASATSLVSGPATWYGSDEDAGTPGYDAGGPLPVELSMFYPARDKITGAVVIKWETQSELNNAGFFIKRSQQRSTNFKVINATMISGAGTISEKQSYTYTDTTAQPNVVYYYQIEDVSLDGNRQLLTRGTRLRGHIGAAGKATVIWGDLKTLQ